MRHKRFFALWVVCSFFSCSPYSNLTEKQKEAYRKDYYSRFKQLETISKFIQLTQKDTLVDIASGGGHSISILAKYLPPETTFFVEDIDKKFCSKKIFTNNFKFYRATIDINRFKFFIGEKDKVPFTSNSFSHVTVFISLHEFEFKEKMLDEMYRILRPKGKLYVYETVSKNTCVVKDKNCGFNYLQNAELSQLISSSTFKIEKDTILSNQNNNDSSFARFLVLEK